MEEHDPSVDPLTAFTLEEYKRWNLNVGRDPITQIWNGESEEYETWRDLMVDVCSGQWLAWRSILDNLVTLKEPIRLGTIRDTNKCLGLTGKQHVVLSNVLWSHLGRCMDGVQRKQRKRLAGEMRNGYELWRRLYWDNLDGESVSGIRGAAYFRNFPRCTTMEGQQAHIDEWLLLEDDVAPEIR